MLPYVIFFVMLVSLTLLIAAYYNNHSSSTAFKGITSSLFIGIGLSSYLIFNTDYIYFILIFLGLCSSFVGDVALAMFNSLKCDNKKPFLLGIASFSITHILYFIAFCSFAPASIRDLIVYIPLVCCAIIFLLRCKSLDFKGCFKFIICYVLLVTAMLIKAISLNCLIKENPVAIILITSGALLFFISDFILCFIYFKKDHKSYLSALNLICYYIGQGLIALSIIYI